MYKERSFYTDKNSVFIINVVVLSVLIVIILISPVMQLDVFYYDHKCTQNC
jgi:Flp pilus assembly protein protease CpaA